MKALLKTITTSEWRFVCWLTLAVLALTGLPYLYGSWSAPAGTTYDGLHALAPGDVPVYYSYLYQIKAGEVLVKDLFTDEPQPLGTFNVWWFLVGTVARWLNLSPPLAFQLSRLLMIPVFTAVAYVFLSYIFSERAQRQLALVFLLFSSGLGVYAAGLLKVASVTDAETYRWPIDLWITEAVTFNALYQTPHFIASLTLMLLIFLLTLLAWERHRVSYAVVGGLLALFYFNFHPYYWPVIFGVLGLYLAIKTWQAKKILWWQAGYLGLVFLISLPSIAYHVWLLSSSPVIGQRALQNVTAISPWPFVLIGYGLLWPGLIVGVFYAWKKQHMNHQLQFLLVWFVVAVALIYSPLPFHSRYTQGLHVVLVTFTVVGLSGIWDDCRLRLTPGRFDFWFRNPTLWLLLFLGFFGASNLYSVARDLYYFSAKPAVVEPIFYLPNDAVVAMSWLGGQPAGTVLAAEIPSKFLPGFSGHVVYAAHDDETLYFEAKQPLVFWFYADNKNDQAKQRFLLDRQISYVFYSAYERELGSFNPAGKDYLELVFDTPTAQIYRV